MAKKAVLTEYQLAVSGIKQPLRVALIADVHERKNDDVLALLQQAKPDIITVAGDTLERFDRETGRPYRKNAYSPLHRAFLMVAFQFNYLFIRLFGRKNLPDTQNAYALLQGAARLAPVFVSLGNHEEKLLEEDVAFLNENGITLLDNADVKTIVCGEHVRIGGLSTAADEGWLRRFDKKDGLKILLCHHPEYYDRMVADTSVDVVLSGHNHGGQIRLFKKPLFSAGGGILPKYGYGMFHKRLVVSAGCSNTVAVPRVNNPRELVMITLIPNEKTG